MLDSDVTKLTTMAPDATDGLFPIFHYETRIDEEATTDDGPNVYKKVAYVEIICPGNDKERINRKVKDRDKQRWPVQWQQFMEHGEGAEVPVDGMPVEEWPMVDAAQARTLKESNIYTVEQLSEVADINIQGLGPGMILLRQKAQKWVRDKAGAGEEIESLKKKIEEIKAQQGETIVEVAVKVGGWYTYRGKKYREADLPDQVKAALLESEE